MPHCGGCNGPFAVLARPVKAPATRRRCDACFRAKRFWLQCADCGRARGCRHYAAALLGPPRWLCAVCWRHRELFQGRIAPVAWRSGLEGDPERIALYDAHLLETRYVDGWIVPESSEWCLLCLARLILFRRFGFLAGLVHGAGATRWSNGTKIVDTDALAQHLEDLRAGGKWPGGSEPVLLSGCKVSHATAVARKLQRDMGWPAAQRNRLVPLPRPLSEHGGTRGFRLAAFLVAPRSTDCELVRRCKRVLQVAQLQNGVATSLTAAHPQLAAFRRMLFTR